MSWLVLVVGSTFDALYTSQLQHCGTFIPAKTGSTPVYGWCSTLDTLSSSHPEITGTRRPSLPLDWNSLFFGWTPSPISQYCKIAMMQSNQVLHSVTNDLCLSNFNSSLIKWAKSMHFWTCIRQTTPISQLWGPCLSQSNLIGVVFWSLSKPHYMNKFKELLQWASTKQTGHHWTSGVLSA